MNPNDPLEELQCERREALEHSAHHLAMVGVKARVLVAARYGNDLHILARPGDGQPAITDHGVNGTVVSFIGTFAADAKSARYNNTSGLALTLDPWAGVTPDFADTWSVVQRFTIAGIETRRNFAVAQIVTAAISSQCLSLARGRVDVNRLERDTPECRQALARIVASIEGGLAVCARKVLPEAQILRIYHQAMSQPLQRTIEQANHTLKQFRGRAWNLPNAPTREPTAEEKKSASGTAMVAAIHRYLQAPKPTSSPEFRL